MTETDFTPEQAEQAIGILLGAAETTAEIRALTRIAVRADFLWLCKCRAANYPSRTTCDSCREPRA